MPAEPGRTRRAGRRGAVTGLLAALAVTLAVTLAGCTPSPGPDPSSVSPTASATPHVFTVVTTEAPQSYDPAAIHTSAGSIIALNVFQRLLVLHADTDYPKPDAADCLFTSPTVYECTLRKGLTFSNGDALTASDVKFSIERAYRLNVAKTSIKMFNSLQRIEAVDDLTVRFTLRWADSQFGHALATPAASIVDEAVYDPDAVRPNTEAPVGSGPFSMGVPTDQGVTMTRNETYQGANGANLPKARVEFAKDITAVEAVLNGGSADVVWRSLDAAALSRIASGATKTTLTAADLPKARMERLIWNLASPFRARADLRTAVSDACQSDRSVTSLVPSTVAGSVESFPVGGRPTAAALTGERLNLTLSYASKAPGQGDLARLLRDRLEDQAGISVQLKPDTDGADLWLTDEPAWTNTALGWLQPYVDEPLPGTADKISQLDQGARQATDATARTAFLAEIQQQAASDLTVLPISLGSETLLVKPGVKVGADDFGPAWQLGLWGFTQ